MKTPTRLHRSVAIVGLAAALTLGACASSAAPAATSSPPASGSPSASPAQPTPSDVAGGGGSSGDPGTGIGGPVDPAPPGPDTGAKLVVAKPGQLNPRKLPAGTLEASVDGRRVLVKATWWSGVEPCNVLDSVQVDRLGTHIAITLIEGTSDLNAMCIEIAMQKATIVDLGELEPGTYTISSPGGDATPITVTVN